LGDSEAGGTSKIAVAVLAVAEGKGVDAMVRFVFFCAVVEEAADESTLSVLVVYNRSVGKGGGVRGTEQTYRSRILVNHNSQSIESACSVYTRRPNVPLSVIHIPYLQITTPAFLTSSTEINVYRPFGML
jgi:hypothetical protein